MYKTEERYADRQRNNQRKTGACTDGRGVTDLAFRHICREHGAALTVTEMVSAKALCYKDKKTPRLLELGADEHPVAARFSGTEPDTMAEGAKLALENPAVISSTSTWAVRRRRS